MFTSKRCALLLALVASAHAAAETPELGQPVSRDEVAALSLTVFPDGAGLPPGRGTVAEGSSLYAQHCLACHGPRGKDGTNDRLAGGHGTLTETVPIKTVGSYWPYATTVFDYVRRAMPYRDPGSLNDNEVYALTAYLLHLNGLLGPDDSVDARNLAEIHMPNRDNFTWSLSENDQ